jgi:hypothetical protein
MNTVAYINYVTLQVTTVAYDVTMNGLVPYWVTACQSMDDGFYKLPAICSIKPYSFVVFILFKTIKRVSAIATNLVPVYIVCLLAVYGSMLFRHHTVVSCPAPFMHRERTLACWIASKKCIPEFLPLFQFLTFQSSYAKTTGSPYILVKFNVTLLHLKPVNLSFINGWQVT